MAEDVVPAPEAESKSWLGETVLLPAANGIDFIPFTVWWSGDEKFSLTFGTPGGTLAVNVWLETDGLERLEEAVKDALVARAIAKAFSS